MAQNISSDSQWYDGWNNYVASYREDGKILMQAMAEGEKLEFQLFPVKDEDYDYILLEGPDKTAELPYPEELTVKYFHEDGKEVLCLYEYGELTGVMVKTILPSRVNSALNLNTRLNGTYRVDPYGNTIVISDGVGTFDGRKVYFKMETFNDLATGVLKVDSGSPVEGSWEFVPTVAGFHVYPGTFDSYPTFQRTGEPFTLIESDPAKGRFDFASRIILDNACLRRYKKSTLRLMRGEILARHGYVFDSEDLQAYFAKQPWYKPVASNEGIELSFIERLNVDLIKNAESDPDHDQFVSEE